MVEEKYREISSMHSTTKEAGKYSFAEFHLHINVYGS